MKSKAISYPYVGWMALFVIAPILIITVYAFTTNGWDFTLDNFQDMAQYASAFGRSFALAAVATVVCLLIGYPMAYFLARESGWLNRMATMLIMLPMWMNFLLRTYSWKFLLERNGLLNSFFGLFGLGPFQMIDTQGAIVLGMVYNFLPYMVLPIFTVIEKIDPKVIEAAQDLGANNATVFRRVIFPLSLPGVLSGITMVFIPSVSTFAISRLLGGSKTLLLGNLIDMQFVGAAYNPHLGSAISLVMMVIVMVCMALMNHFGDGEQGVAL
jgi:spermidine/putrescine transport system permease protein